MRPIDPQQLHNLEEKAREIGRLIGRSVDSLGKGEYGFALMMFSYEGPELTWISNARREDMIKVLDEFRKRLAEGSADELSRPKGRG